MSQRHPKKKKGSGRFARLPLTVLGKDSVLELSHTAFRVMVILTAQYNGHNNGELALTSGQAKSQGVSRNSLYKALASLESNGLIDRTYPSSRVPPRPTMFALTWIPLDDTKYTTTTRTPARIFRNKQ